VIICPCLAKLSRLNISVPCPWNYLSLYLKPSTRLITTAVTLSKIDQPRIMNLLSVLFFFQDCALERFKLREESFFTRAGPDPGNAKGNYIGTNYDQPSSTPKLNPMKNRVASAVGARDKLESLVVLSVLLHSILLCVNTLSSGVLPTTWCS
jgi:hypothetical protein